VPQILENPPTFLGYPANRQTHRQTAVKTIPLPKVAEVINSAVQRDILDIASCSFFTFCKTHDLHMIYVCYI